MTTEFARFHRVVRELAPKAAIVLGSGLNGAATDFREMGSIAFVDVPGLVPTTVGGHPGRIAIGRWNDVPTLLFLGRLHVYEGHERTVVTRPIELAADFGVQLVVLTNAAGGINPALTTGSLMLIRSHLRFIGSGAWQSVAAGTGLASPYSPRLLRLLQDQEGAAGRDLPTGVYAALTGPCYETPAEIRALAAAGADVVGMSTALEAEAAADLGLDLVAISCITNATAGPDTRPLDHANVLANAKLSVERLGELLGQIVREA